MASVEYRDVDGDTIDPAALLLDLLPDLIEFLGPRVLNIEDSSWIWGVEDGTAHDQEIWNMRGWLDTLRKMHETREVAE